MGHHARCGRPRRGRRRPVIIGRRAMPAGRDRCGRLVQPVDTPHTTSPAMRVVVIVGRKRSRLITSSRMIRGSRSVESHSLGLHDPAGFVRALVIATRTRLARSIGARCTMTSRAGANARAKTRAKRATTKRHVNKREREAAAQDPPPRRNRHAKLVRNPGERSDGARRSIEQGEIERRGGRDRSERKGAPPLAHVRGAQRHSRARSHGSAGR